MIRNGMARKVAYQQKMAQEAEDIKQLKEQWRVYPMPLHAMLDLHLHVYGVRSAQDAPDILTLYAQSLRNRLMDHETQEDSCNT